jgi:hypothetical protein
MVTGWLAVQGWHLPDIYQVIWIGDLLPQGFCRPLPQS